LQIEKKAGAVKFNRPPLHTLRGGGRLNFLYLMGLAKKSGEEEVEEIEGIEEVVESLI
jgi:hypothetical protein